MTKMNKPNIGYLIRKTLKPEVVEQYNKNAIAQGFEGFTDSPPMYISPRGLVRDNTNKLWIGWPDAKSCTEAFITMFEIVNNQQPSRYNYEMVRVSVDEESISRWDEETETFVKFNGIEEDITHEIEGHWTREPLKEPGTYFYTFKKFNGEWSYPSKHYLIENMKFPENQLRWSEKVEEWVPDLPKDKTQKQ